MGQATSTFIVYIGSQLQSCPNVNIFLNAQGVARDLKPTDLYNGWFVWQQDTPDITFTVRTTGGTSKLNLATPNGIGIWELSLDHCTTPILSQLDIYPGSPGCSNRNNAYIVDFNNVDPSTTINLSAEGFNGPIDITKLHKGVFTWCQHDTWITFVINGLEYTLPNGGYVYRVVNGIPEFTPITPAVPPSQLETSPSEESTWTWFWWILGIILVIIIILLVARGINKSKVSVMAAPTLSVTT